jgi:hypothetical protein
MSHAFRTPKGTELPLRSLQGADYLDVKWRIVWMREIHPDWGIETRVIHHDDKYSVCEAVIKDATGRIMGMGHQREDLAHFKDHLAKSETAAIGRALALCGFGTQFTDDLDEGDRIVDAPVSRTSKGGVSAITPSAPAQAVSQKLGIVATPAAPMFDRKAINEKLMALYETYKLRTDLPAIEEVMFQRFKLREARLLAAHQLQEILDYMTQALATTAPAQAALPGHPLDTFEIKVKGPHLGQTFAQVGRKELEAYAKNSQEWFLKEKKTITKPWQEFFSKAEEWIYGATPVSDDDVK